RQAFLGAIDPFLDAMPDRLPFDRDHLRTRVAWPGIDAIEGDPVRHDTCHVAWVGRWEHDKRPGVFFDAVRAASDRVPLRLVVLGESYTTIPEPFDRARTDLAHLVSHWGYAPTREAYEGWLRGADLVVSTAAHEFFGLAIMEAASAGALPVLPRALAYPELFDEDDARFYDDERDLPDLLVRLAQERPDGPRASARRFDWSRRAPALDDMLEDAASRGASSVRPP
ncbi:MAG: glycosyltransferase, partial [Phycisphaerales bacterium]|nr:glycosyltransferase [Phycisphaerales bacterium]